jgi:hypothetical protein
MSGFNVQSVLCDGLHPSNVVEEPLAAVDFVKAYQCFGVPLTSSLSTQVELIVHMNSLPNYCP